MTLRNLYKFYFLLSLGLILWVIGFHLGYPALTLFFFFLGLTTYLWDQQKSLLLFLLILPLVNSLPGIFGFQHPFNYLILPIFYLSGMGLVFVMRRVSFPLSGPFRWYLLFLTLILISGIFVFIRWSNLTISTQALFKNTPVEPFGDRVSFGCIFPVLTLALFTISPLVYFLIKDLKLTLNKIVDWLGLGYLLSLMLGLIQRFLDPQFMGKKWWDEVLGQVNAGFSDFNSFGFFSGVIFLLSLFLIIDKFSPKYLTYLVMSVVGIILSGARGGFLFILLGVVFFFVTRKVSVKLKLILMAGFLMAGLVTGGIMKKRLIGDIERVKQIFYGDQPMEALNKLSNGRIEMLNNSWHLWQNHLLAGVGAGNFLFYLKYIKFPSTDYLSDLPLNQYLLVLDETGLVGIMIFIIFLTRLFRRKSREGFQYFNFLLAAVLAALFLNNYLWFGELMVLFWIILTFREFPGSDDKLDRKVTWSVLAVLVTFVILNIISFNQLHPKTWAKQSKTGYDYGFWYKERNPAGRGFKWSRGTAGQYLYLDGEGRSREIELFCGAPLRYLEGKKQRVEVFWKGNPVREIIFRENRMERFHINGKPGSEGFITFRVTPVFNLKYLKLSEESRSLGIQFFNE